MGLNLPQVPAPTTALMPQWVQAYTDAVRLMANATVNFQAQPPYGGGAWTFSGSNAVLTLKMNLIPTMDPSALFSGTLQSRTGTINVRNGVILQGST